MVREVGKGEEASNTKAAAMLDRVPTAEVHVARGSDTVTTGGFKAVGAMGPAV